MMSQDHNGSSQTVEGCKLFIGGLHLNTDEKSLKDYFEKYGEIVETSVKVDPVTKRRRGFGFLTFKHRESVDQVLRDKEEHGHVVDGKSVDPKIAVPDDVSMRGARGGGGGATDVKKTNKVFVGGVPHDMDEETISDYFKKFGEIEEVALVTSKESKGRRGFIFVTFTSVDAVDELVKEQYHYIPYRQDGEQKDHRVEVKRATPRDQTPRPAGRGGGGWHGGRGGDSGPMGPYSGGPPYYAHQGYYGGSYFGSPSGGYASYGGYGGYGGGGYGGAGYGYQQGGGGYGGSGHGGYGGGGGHGGYGAGGGHGGYAGSGHGAYGGGGGGGGGGRRDDEGYGGSRYGGPVRSQYQQSYHPHPYNRT